MKKAQLIELINKKCDDEVTLNHVEELFNYVPLPTPIDDDDIDWTPLKELVAEYLAYVKSIAYDADDDDYEYYIYEEVLKTIYGNDIFDNYINKVLR